MKHKRIELTYTDGFKNGYEQAIKDFNTPKFPIMERYDNSKCPRCGRYFDEYETNEDSVIWRAVTLERCPWCGQKLKWR